MYIVEKHQTSDESSDDSNPLLLIKLTLSYEENCSVPAMPWTQK